MKKKETKLFIAAAVLLMCCLGLSSQVTPEKKYDESLFTLGEIASIEINMPDSTWQALIGHPSEKTYHVCDITINGEAFEQVAIRTKGASSLDDVKTMKSDRFSFTLKLNKYKKGQKYHGMTKLLLNNNIWDATQMKDAVVYDMCHYIGLPAPLTNYARITVNGKYFGCYLMVEAVDKHFCKRNYSDEESNIYKPYHNLSYTGDDLKRYDEISNYAKVNGGEASIQRVVVALKSVDEGKDIDEHVDVESVMKYMAMQTFDTLLQKRAASVLGQMKGSIPSTWDAQKAEPEKLINSDDINLSDLGGLMVMENK